MKNTIAIRRENLSKKGEKRVAIVPALAEELTQAGVRLLVQPRTHPETGEIKRAYEDEDYLKAQAEIAENIDPARVIFGLKEIDIADIQAEKAYFFFSHTHKGQVKNRKMLRTLVEQKCTLIDYELITDDRGARHITAFTYFAGYAGMIDTLWAYGRQMALEGIDHPFSKVPQSIEKEDLQLIKGILREIGTEIEEKGTPENLPPFINVVLGNGKTSTGAQEIFDILPHRHISLEELPEIYANGSRKQVYKLVLDIHEMFRLKKETGDVSDAYGSWTTSEKHEMYFRHPEYFESNLDGVLPYATLLMNCILWSPQYPRTLSKELMSQLWESGTPLKTIGDITCDPNGSIEFSKETWIDNPVYMYAPNSGQMTDGIEKEGIAVMAVTNLPCEFSADASSDFSKNLKPFAKEIVAADWDGTLHEAGLPSAISKACILWKGRFTEPYEYMQTYLDQE